MCQLKNKFYRYATPAVEQQLSQQLGLPWHKPMQDWDLTCANSHRIHEFLAYYQHSTCSDDERFALMQLIMASFDDFLEEYERMDVSLWDVASSLLHQSCNLHITTIYHWALPWHKNNTDRHYKLTPYIRPIWDAVKHPYLS